jgi:hypothetical protein
VPSQLKWWFTLQRDQIHALADPIDGTSQDTGFTTEQS